MLVAAICLLGLLIRNDVAIPLATSHHYRLGPAEGTVEVMDWGLTRAATFLVMFGMIYVGLFFVLADKKEKP